MFADRLKKSLLQAAIQGQLTEQLPTDGDARDLLRKIRAEKTKLIATKKIKAEKPLPPFNDDEIPFDIPDNWCWVRLGDVCQINPRNKLEAENIDATFLPMTAINDGYSNGYNPLVKSWNEIRSGLRNANSDAHGLGTKRKFNIKDYHARLLVNSAMTLSDFILSVAENNLSPK